ncbi:hypothetical protein [Desertivirga xinjiangensis]|uniref:hypothetical protein n=1 Tax=Desertivirga xinjiangensis TaxID=539206 RepID=UPI00210A818D|nr:hypothetical protein [Pedobacter xinjiangensis]
MYFIFSFIPISINCKLSASMLVIKMHNYGNIMAEIHVQRKRKSSWWLWLIIILILAVVLYLLYNYYYGGTVSPAM